MAARLLFFGRVRDLGSRLEAAPADVRTLGELWAWIAREAPDIADLLKAAKARVAIDGEIEENESVSILAAREIAFLPPMSGG